MTDKRYSQFLDAVERGVQYLINHPDKSWQLFIRAHKNLDDELNREPGEIHCRALRFARRHWTQSDTADLRRS